MVKEVREAEREGKRARWRNKKARDFTHFLTQKSTLLSTVDCAHVLLVWEEIEKKGRAFSVMNALIV